MKGLVFLHLSDGVQDVGEVAVVAPHSLPVLVQDPLVLGAYYTQSRFLILNLNTSNSGCCTINPNVFENKTLVYYPVI
jgi:hypothetical protein